LDVDIDMTADNFFRDNLRLHRSGFPDFRNTIFDQADLSALWVFDHPLLHFRVVEANVENVFVVSTSQRPPVAPGRPKTLGAELEESLSVLVAGYRITEVSVGAAECNGCVVFGDIATVAADRNWRLRENRVFHGGLVSM
jgi:hypothetical protein